MDDTDIIPIGTNPQNAGDKEQQIAVKEVHKSEKASEKSMKKIKPCPVAAARRRSDSPSPPPSPPATDASWSPAGEPSFSWDSLMRQPTFEAAPVACFPHAPLCTTWRNICAGLKVELAQRQPGKAGHTTYWVATLLQVQGYRGLFRPEGLGSDRSLDRWLEVCSPFVKPVGWCAARGLPLTPPAAAGPDRDWQRLLVRTLTGTRTLPAGFHRKVLAGLSSQLSVGQTVEVVDKACISQVRAARVTRLIGRRLHVHYLDAPADDGGFWCHENSPLVHPVGWAMAVGHRIQAPADYLDRCATRQFLDSDATEDYLPAPPPVTHEGFKVGMKLEALDPLNLNTIGVATVCKALANHFMMVRLETAPDAEPFCYHAASPYVFPAGFCRTVGIPLTPPHGFTADMFSWEDYLTSQRAAAAPAHLFHRPPLSHGFQPGQRLEAVDLMDPQLVCVATVAAVVGRLLRVHFDGWEDQFDQWADVQSPDLFPVGWCQLVGYPLEPPRAAERPAPRRVPRKRPGTRRGRPRLRGGGGGGGGGGGAGRPPKSVTDALRQEVAAVVGAQPGSERSGGRGRPAPRPPTEDGTETESLAEESVSCGETGHGDDSTAQEDRSTPVASQQEPTPPTPSPERERVTGEPTPGPEHGPDKEQGKEPELEMEQESQADVRPMEVEEVETDPKTGETSGTPGTCTEVAAPPGQAADSAMEV